MSSEAAFRTPPLGTSTDNAPVEGLLFVNSSIKNKSISESTLHEWYSEHMDHVLSAPNNSGLFLRYRNLRASEHIYTNPDYASRSAAITAQDQTWPFLALVKLNDIHWLKTPGFLTIPITSALLPPEGMFADKEKGHGAAFDAFTFGARACSLVARDPASSTTSPQSSSSPLSTSTSTSTPKHSQPTHLVVVQKTAPTTASPSQLPTSSSAQTLEKTLSTLSTYRGSISYSLEPNFIPFQEPGDLPPRLTIYQYDINNHQHSNSNSNAEAAAGVSELVKLAEELTDTITTNTTMKEPLKEEEKIIRVDIWQLIDQRGSAVL